MTNDEEQYLTPDLCSNPHDPQSKHLFLCSFTTLSTLCNYSFNDSLTYIHSLLYSVSHMSPATLPALSGWTQLGGVHTCSLFCDGAKQWNIHDAVNAHLCVCV